MVLAMAIAYCLDFYLMTWAFGSRLFGVHAALRTVVVTVIWFALPQWRASVIPVAVALAYFVTVILIPPLRRQWLKEQTRRHRSCDTAVIARFSSEKRTRARGEVYKSVFYGDKR